MRKFLAALCVTLSCFGLVGCGASETLPPSDPPPVTFSATEQVYRGKPLYPTVTLFPSDLGDVTLSFTLGGEAVAEAALPGTYRVLAAAEDGRILAEEDFIIRPAPIDLASVPLPPKKFDGTDGYEIRTGNLPGKARGDALYLEISARFAGPEAGKNKPLTVYSVRLTGAAADRYKLSKAAELFADIID